MQVLLNKDKCSAIDASFAILKKEPHNLTAINIIKKTLEECFKDYKFDVKVLNTDLEENIFLMSIYPEISTIDKIIESILKDGKDDTIKKLWESNKFWTIEIDANLLLGKYIECDEKELTAMLLHEIGHVVYSNSLPNKITTIFKYEVTKSSFANKAIIKKDKIFRNILSLPILDACINDNKRTSNSIKEEIKADNFVKKIGYSKELESVLTKIMKCKSIRTSNNIDEKIANSTSFSLDSLDNFRLRRDKLAKNNLLSLRKECGSDYINNVIDSFINTVFEETDCSDNMSNGRKIEYMHERVEKEIEDECYMEFFFLNGKKLKRIEPNDLDYAEIKASGIETDSDKMMVVSYVNSKIDLVDYYISILKNPISAKKYNIPHTLNELYDIKKRLLIIRDNAMKKSINSKMMAVPNVNHNISYIIGVD